MNCEITILGEKKHQDISGQIIFGSKSLKFEISPSEKREYILYLKDSSSKENIKWFFPDQEKCYYWNNCFKIIKWTGENIENLLEKIEAARRKKTEPK